MAKATAECTCKTCGKVYTATKICRNRRDADEWEQWATEHYKEKIDELLARKPTEKGMRYITWIVQTHTDAKYWIDNRDWSLHGKWGIKLWDEWKATAIGGNTHGIILPMKI